jgi:hypothetical protein
MSNLLLVHAGQPDTASPVSSGSTDGNAISSRKARTRMAIAYPPKICNTFAERDLRATGRESPATRKTGWDSVTVPRTERLADWNQV